MYLLMGFQQLFCFLIQELRRYNTVAMAKINSFLLLSLINLDLEQVGKQCLTVSQIM